MIINTYEMLENYVKREINYCLDEVSLHATMNELVSLIRVFIIHGVVEVNE